MTAEGVGALMRKSIASDFARLLAALALAVAGNAAYDTLKGELNVAWVLLYCVAAVVTTVIWILLLRSVSSYDRVLAAERPFHPTSPLRVLNTVAGSLLLGLLTGLIVSGVSALAFSTDKLYYPLAILPGIGPYEIVAFLGYGVVSLIFTRRQVDWVALTTFGFAFAAASSVVVNLLHADVQDWLPTIVSYCWLSVGLLAIALLLQPMMAVLIRELTRQR